MPKCEFSETQFSFCFTFEFLDKYCPWSIIPYFPSTYIEGQPGHGFDVQIAGHIYLQFKIPKFITIRRLENRIQWDSFGTPFYRSKIETNSEQHKLLKKLKTSDNEVFYVMPEFNDNNSISLCYYGGTIVENSAFFSINDLPPYGSGYHNLCYVPRASFGKVFSDPIEIKKSNLAESMQLMLQRESTENTVLIEAKRLRNILIEEKFTLPEYPPLHQITEDQLLVRSIKTILLSYFNVLWTPIIHGSHSSITISRR